VDRRLHHESCVKHGRLARVSEHFRTQLWLAPTIAAVLAFAAVQLLALIDRRVIGEADAWFLFGKAPEGARELLSTIATAMMTFTGLVFTITILVLQLASNQFSPRVMRTFLEDRQTHVAMGTFVGTLVFALAAMPAVRQEEGYADQFVPALTLFVAFLLVLASVAVFVRYIDHMAHSVRAITIIKHVATEAQRTIEDHYPQQPFDAAERGAGPMPVHEPEIHRHTGSPGVLAMVDEAELMKVARRGNGVIEVVPIMGDFVPCGAPLLRTWDLDGAHVKRARKAVALEEERTPHQDPAFGFRQLVDMGERALSPSTNDPSTAVQVVDELHELLRRLATRQFPSPVRVDDEGAVRLILSRPDWESYVRLALDEIRQYGARSIQIRRRLRAVLEDLLALAPPVRRPILHEQLVLLDACEQDAEAEHGISASGRWPSLQGHGPH
jgi:uncharacterized membrane protein